MIGNKRPHLKTFLFSATVLLFFISCKKSEPEMSDPNAVFSAGLEDRYLAPFGCPKFLIRRNLEELNKSGWSFGSLNVREMCQNRTKTSFETGLALETFLENLVPLKLGNTSLSVSHCIDKDLKIPSGGSNGSSEEKRNTFGRAVVADYYYTMNKISHGVVGTIEAIANLDILLGLEVPLPKMGSVSKEVRYADNYVPKSKIWVKELGNEQTCHKEKVTIPRGSFFCNGQQVGLNDQNEEVCFVEPFTLLLEQTRIVFRALARISLEIGIIEQKIIENSVDRYLTRSQIVDRAYVMDGYGVRPSGMARTFESEFAKAVASLEAADRDIKSKQSNIGFTAQNRSSVEKNLAASRPLIKQRAKLIEQFGAWTSTVPWLKISGFDKSGFKKPIEKYAFWENYLFNLPDSFDVKKYHYQRHAKPFSYADENGNSQVIDLAKVDPSSAAFIKRIGVAADMAVRQKTFVDAVILQLRENRNNTYEKLLKYYKAARCIHNHGDAFFDKPILSALSDKCQTVVTEVLAELPEVYGSAEGEKTISDKAFFADVAFTNPSFDKDNRSKEAVFQRLSVANEISQAQCRTSLRENNSTIHDVHVNAAFAIAFAAVGIVQGAKFAPVVFSEIAGEYTQAARLTGEAYVNYLKTTAVEARFVSAAARASIYLKAMQQSRAALGFSRALATLNGSVAVLDITGAIRICEEGLRSTMSVADRDLVTDLMRPNLFDRPTCPATPEIFAIKKGNLGTQRVLPIKMQRALIANAESGMTQCLLGVGVSVLMNSVQIFDDIYRVSSHSDTIQKLRELHR